jgi:outer membrane protein assembly factor BamB
MKSKLLISTILLAATGCSGLRIERTFKPEPSDWTLYGGAPSRSNVVSMALRPPLEEAWEYNALAGITASPLVRDSVVIISTLNGEVQAIHPANGKRLGYVVLDAPIAGTPVLDNNVLIVPLAGAKETLVAFSLRNSDRLWSINLGPIESSPLLYGDLLYTTTIEGMVYCLRKNDGTEIWKFATGTEERRKPIRSSPATDGTTIFFGGDDGTIYALESRAGTLRWKFNARASVFASPIVAGGAVLVGTLGGVFYSLDAADGTVRWLFDAGSPIYGAAAANEQTVFVGSADGNCYALDLQTGRILWRFSTRSVVNSAPLIAQDVLYWGSMDRTLYALDVRSGKTLWKYDALGRIKVPPVIWGNLLLVTSEDKFVVALRPSP